MGARSCTLRALMQTLRQRYLEIDTRTLGWLRIALGLLLLLDLAKRASDLATWYTNSGFLPNHRMLWLPTTPYQLSYLFSFWTASQIQAAFAVTALVYLAFLLGYRTRLTHLLSWFSLLSLQTRVDLVANGGDYVFCTLMLWSLFLPLGRRYSLDALRERRDPAPERVASLAVPAMLLQLSVIYLFNALNKSGSTWYEGSAVHYMLYQTRIVTALGIWARDHLPAGLFRSLTYGTLVIEFALPALILCPWFGPWPRRLAIFLIWSFHGSISLLANLGLFSPVMMVFAVNLLSAEDHAWLASRRTLAARVGRVRERLEQLHARLRLVEPGQASPPRRTELGERVDTALRWVREGCVVVLLLCAFSQAVLENPRLLGAISHPQPRPVRAIIGYLRLNQGWGMFAPDAPRHDMWLVVDAITASGEHLDPYNSHASVIADPKARYVPPRTGQNYYFCDYTVRIPGEPHFHDPFREWILDHHKRVGRPEERIDRFQVILVEQDSPPPGSREPTNVRTEVVLRGSRQPG